MALKGRLFDPDERVRSSVCKLYVNLDYETALHHVSEDQLRAIGERTMDKKVSTSIAVVVASSSHNYTLACCPTRSIDMYREAVQHCAS